MNRLLDQLKGGDRRSIGQADTVVDVLKKDPSRFQEVLKGINNQDPVIRMRAADVVEKVTRDNHGLLKGYEKEVIDEYSKIEQQEVCWHIALLLPRLSLGKKELEKVVDILRLYLEHDSKIVRVNAMQALADLVIAHGSIKKTAVQLIASTMIDGSPAVKARGKKLLKSMER